MNGIIKKMERERSKHTHTSDKYWGKREGHLFVLMGEMMLKDRWSIFDL